MKIEKISGFSAKWDAKLHPILHFWAKYWGFSIDFDLIIHKSLKYISLIFNNICEHILCRGIAGAMQEEKRKEEKRKKKETILFFFLMKKTKLCFGMSLNGLNNFMRLKHQSIPRAIQVRI